MAASQWLDKQIAATRSLLKQGSEALREGNLELAHAALMESAIVLDMNSEETEEGLQLRAQAFNELGVVHQRRNDIPTSKNFHEQAAAICDKIVEGGNLDFRGNTAATHLNLSNLCAAVGDVDGARAAIERSKELADTLMEEGEDTIRMMSTAIYMTKASMHAASGEFDESDVSMTRATELGRALIEEDNKQLYAQLAQGCQQLSVLLFQADQFEPALKWGREAEALSEEAFEELGQDFVSIYIVSQINLISYNEKLGHFADAEDSLFKALEVVGNDPRLLKRGKDLYDFLRKQADARLEKGGLPRTEVEESYEEILERIEEIGGLPEEVEQDVAEA